MQRGEAALRQRPDLTQRRVKLRRQGRLGPPGLAVGGRPLGRQGEALVGVGGGDHPLPAPILPLSASEAGDVGRLQIIPCLEVVRPDFILALPGLHQNEEVAEEDDAGPHPHEHHSTVSIH